jgi:hypothetical protein
LIHEAGVPEERIATMTLQEAVEAMNAHWSPPKR